MQYQLNISVVQAAKRHIAMTKLGGIPIRGKSAETVADAIRNLLWALAQTNDDDASLAVELLAAGQDLTHELTSGNAD